MSSQSYKDDAAVRELNEKLAEATPHQKFTAELRARRDAVERSGRADALGTQADKRQHLIRIVEEEG